MSTARDAGDGCVADVIAEPQDRLRPFSYVHAYELESATPWLGAIRDPAALPEPEAQARQRAPGTRALACGLARDFPRSRFGRGLRRDFPRLRFRLGVLAGLCRFAAESETLMKLHDKGGNDHEMEP